MSARTVIIPALFRLSCPRVVGVVLLLGVACWLRMPVHAAGLPGEFVASHQWRNLFSFRSPLSNPSLMTDESYPTLRGVLSFSADQIAHLWETGLTVPIGLYQSAGLTWVAEHGLPLENGEFDESGEYQVSATQVNNDNSLFVGSYAINPWRRLSVGANVKYFHQTGFGTPRSGLGVDGGVSYRLLHHPLLGYHILGVGFHNLFSLKSGTDEGPDAALLKLTYHSTMFESRFEIDAQYDMVDFAARPSDFLEAKSGEWRFSAQAGLWLLRFFKLKGYMGMGNYSPLEYWGIGAGINAPSLNNGRDFAVTYQFRSENSASLAPSHSLYLVAAVGKHREEVYARKMARALDISANGLYNKALRLYYSGQYWEAYFIFTQIINGFPDFFKNDWVAYYQGACLEGLDMRKAALEAYDYAEVRRSDGEVTAYSQLGRMRIFYREGRDSDVQQVFSTLTTSPSAPDSLKHHAYYLMGQTHLKAGRYAYAIQAFRSIPDVHPEFVFAQHSLAVAHILNGTSIDEVVIALENSVGAIALTPAGKEIVNRSYLLFGYLFHEEKALAKAVTALLKIPPESFYYEEALLGLAWTAQKAAQKKDCMGYGLQLTNKSTQPLLQCEGLLVQAYGYMLDKNFEQAKLLLEAAKNSLAKYKVPSPDELEIERNKYHVSRIAYDQLADEVVAMASKAEMLARFGKQVDSLRSAQVQNKAKLDGFIRLEDRARRNVFFDRSASTISQDVDYSLATVQAILKNRSSIKSVQKAQDEAAQMEQEIERLRRELNK